MSLDVVAQDQTTMVLGFGVRTVARVFRGFRGDPVPIPVTPSQNMVTEHFVRPSDIDIFFHLNNAMYLRHAELARWELLPRTGLLQKAIKDRWMFLVVSQDADYLKPLPPLAKFTMNTRAEPDETGKYLMFTHDFLYKDEMYATARVKAIVKRTTGDYAGQTVKPKDMPEFFAAE